MNNLFNESQSMSGATENDHYHLNSPESESEVDADVFDGKRNTTAIVDEATSHQQQHKSSTRRESFVPQILFSNPISYPLSQPQLTDSSEQTLTVGSLSFAVETPEFPINYEMPKSSKNWNGDITDFSGWEEFKQEMFEMTFADMLSSMSTPERQHSFGSGSSGDANEARRELVNESLNESLLKTFAFKTNHHFDQSESLGLNSQSKSLTIRLFLISQPTEFVQGLPNDLDSPGNSGGSYMLRQRSTSLLSLYSQYADDNLGTDLQTTEVVSDGSIKAVDHIIQSFEDNHNIKNGSNNFKPPNTQPNGQMMQLSGKTVPISVPHNSLVGQDFPTFKGLVRSPKASKAPRNDKLLKGMYHNNKNLPFLKLRQTDVSCIGVKLDYGTYVGDSISLLNIQPKHLCNTYVNLETETANNDICQEVLDEKNPKFNNLYPVYYRQKNTRDLHLLLGSIDNIIYYRSLSFGIDQPYEPEYYRIETDEDGNQISETLSGCCAYCKTVKFLPFKNSSYLSHMALEHGIYSSGYFTPNWRNLGRYTRLETSTGVVTLIEAVQCAECSQLIDTSGWSSKKNKMLGYFRHFKLKHNSLTIDKNCAYQYPPIKLRGRTSYLGSNGS